MQWQKFAKHIQSMNDASQENVKYKVLFLGRHGEGVHNVAERRYGTKAWDVCFLSTIPYHYRKTIISS